MPEFCEQPLYSFNRFPPVGEDDWKYAFATAQVRAMETSFIPRSVFVEMANTSGFEAAAECLSGTDYGFVVGAKTMSEIETGLLEKRTQVRILVADLVDNADFLELLRAKTDFANLRLAIRRLVTEKPVGVDYSNEGHVPADKFGEVLEQENYIEFPLFLQEAVELAVLRYYENKSIPQIDYGIDCAASEYSVRKATEINSVFLLELFRMRDDLCNIRTMLRLKFRQSERRDCFLPCGYIDRSVLIHGLDVGYDGLAAMFASTPYFHIVDGGVAYLTRENSFLRLEELCESHLAGFLKSTSQITAGAQPVIAYLLRKEAEIRTVRMILTGQKNHLPSKMLLDRMSHFEE